MTFVNAKDTWQRFMDSAELDTQDFGYQYVEDRDSITTKKERLLLNFKYFSAYKENVTSQERCLRYRKIAKMTDVMGEMMDESYKKGMLKTHSKEVELEGE